MSFVGLLRHTVAVRRRYAVLDAGEQTYDERGQPISETETISMERCRIEPLTAREIALLSQAGAVVADHRLFFLRSAGIDEADQLVEQPPTGTRTFEVAKIDDLGGAGRYVEVMAQAIESADVPVS